MLSEYHFSQHDDKGGKFGISQTEDIDIFKQTSEHPAFGDKVTSFSKNSGRDGATVTIYHGSQSDKNSGITQNYGFDSGKVYKTQPSGFVPGSSKPQPFGHKQSSSGSSYSNNNRGYSGKNNLFKSLELINSKKNCHSIRKSLFNNDFFRVFNRICSNKNN